MKASEFYHQISLVNFGDTDLKTCYQAIVEALLNTPYQNIRWELFIEVLTHAQERAKDKTHEVGNFKQESIMQGADLSNLVKYLLGLIRSIEEDGIPIISYNGLNFYDSHFNWDIHVILERGAAWLTNDGEAKEELNPNPTWADLHQLIKIGREYE